MTYLLVALICYAAAAVIAATQRAWPIALIGAGLAATVLPRVIN